MRTFGSINLNAFTDSGERAQIKVLADMLRQVNGGLARSIFPGTQPAANPVSPPGPTPGLPNPTAGDLLYGLITGTWAKLAIGASGTILTSTGGSPAWATVLSVLPVHDHGGSSTGGNIPESSVTNLVSDLAAKAPSNASYITQTASSGLSAEQALDALATGLLKSTTGTGVITIAAAGDLPTHGAAQHTDRTRTLWLPWQAWADATLLTVPTGASNGSFPTRSIGVPMSGITATQLITEFVVPQDFTSGTGAWSIIYSTTGTDAGTMRFDLYYNVIETDALVDSSNDQTMSATTAGHGTANQLKKFAIGSTVTGLAAGDYVRLSLQRDPTHAGDTNAEDADFLGVQFNYTADS